MPKLHCKRSEYLEKGRRIAKIFASLYALVLIYIIWAVFVKNAETMDTIPGIVAVVFLFGPLAWFVYKRYRKEKETEGNYQRGLKGEGAIYYELKKLKGDFVVFQDIKLGGGNVDFIVIGLNGIFIIEVKSMRGDISFSEERLFCNEKEIEKDMLSQTLKEALSVRDFLKDETNNEFFVHPILVFSSIFARVAFGLRPVKSGVYVVQKRFLRKLIYSINNNISKDDVNNIESSLMKIWK